MNLPFKDKQLKGFSFSGCAVRTKNILGFSAQKWSDGNDDPFEPRPTGLFFYFPDEPVKDRWAFRGIWHATGIHFCPAFEPHEEWVSVMDDGAVYVVGKRLDDFEGAVARSKGLFTQAKCIAGARPCGRRRSPRLSPRCPQSLGPTRPRASSEVQERRHRLQRHRWIQRIGSVRLR